MVHYECEICNEKKPQAAFAVINHLVIICIACDVLEASLIEENEKCSDGSSDLV